MLLEFLLNDSMNAITSLMVTSLCAVKIKTSLKTTEWSQTNDVNETCIHHKISENKREQNMNLFRDPGLSLYDLPMNNFFFSQFD